MKLVQRYRVGNDCFLKWKPDDLEVWYGAEFLKYRDES